MARRLRIGTRGSELALWQARFVVEGLGGAADLVIIKTSGDHIQHVGLHEVEGTGFFTKEIESALLAGDVDVAVHSYKDLPTAEHPDLSIAAVPPRGPVRDVVVHKRDAQEAGMRWSLRRGARVGTASLRRRAQILSLRPDLEVVQLRGNVPTRFRKVSSGELDAVVLAEAGLLRLGLDAEAVKSGLLLTPVDITEICPAPSQGALAIQVRRADSEAAAAVSRMHHEATAAQVRAERLLLGRFGGGCHLPLGVFCESRSERFQLRALVAAPDGARRIEAVAEGPEASALVEPVHAELLRQGAAAYL